MVSVNRIVTSVQEPVLFDKLQGKALALKQGVENIKNLGLDQKDLILRALAQNVNPDNPETLSAIQQFMTELFQGGMTKAKFAKMVASLNKVLPNSAAMKETSKGTAIMAEGWAKPVVFPHEGNFKFLDWADDANTLTTKGLWEGAYGKKPALTMGAVGNSNIKPEQIISTTSECKVPEEILSDKKKLSALYEDAIVEFYTPIVKFLKEQGAKSEDIGMAFAHSDCGVDKAARKVIEENGLKGFATTPTEYTQYLRGKEMPPTEEFPNGYVLADFPYPTVLTRNVGQIEDYAQVYGKMVGEGNPLGVFGGGEHAFARDAREALIGAGGSQAIPVDILKDKYGVIIPAVNDKGIVTNAAKDILERVNGNPYEQFRYAFKNLLPNSKLKEDIAQYDPQAAMATAAYTKLAQEGKIGK